MSKRKKMSPPAAQLIGRAGAEEAMARYRSLTDEDTKIQQRIDAVTARMVERHRSRREEINEELETLAQQLGAWAAANKEEFAGLKSLELAHGTIGWRKGNPALKLVRKKTWEHVLAAIKEADRADLVRTVEEVRKDAILAIRDTEPDLLARIGVLVAQPETFFIEPAGTAAPVRGTISVG